MAVVSDKDSFAFHLVSYLVSASCSGMAEAATFPLDTLKVRMQLSRKGGKLSLQGLYTGFPAAFARQLLYGGASVTLYPYVRSLVAKVSKTSSEDVSFVQKLIAGSISGSVSQLLASPFDVVKIRMQSAATQYKYTGVYNALSTIGRAEGVRGLWRGCGPNMQRAAVLNGFWLSSYDSSKLFVAERMNITNGVVATFLSSTIAGFVCVAATCPFDVAKTRMMSQTQNDTKKYTSMVQCITRTAQTEGVAALYKGFVPSLARMGPWSVVFFIVYEPVCQAVFGKARF